MRQVPWPVGALFRGMSAATIGNMRLGTLAVVALCISAAAASIVRDVRSAIARNDFREGERLIAEHRAASGVTPEMLEALSWLGRGALAARNLEAADRYSADELEDFGYLLKGRQPVTGSTP